MQEMSKTKRTLLIITLFASGTILMSEMILTPTINLLYTLYPDGTNLINYAITGCYLFSTLASLIVGKLCEKYSKKSLLLFGAILGAVGGVGMFFTAQPIYLAIWRTMLMVSYSFTMTVALSFINDIYDNEVERGKMIGFFNGTTTAFGAILSFGAGIFATKSIKSAYSLHFIIIVYLVMVILFVPAIKPQGLSSKEVKTENALKIKAKMGGIYWLVNINYAFYTLAFCTFMYFSSVYVAENNLGDEALSGAVSSVITIIGFITSVSFGKVFEKLGNNIETFSYALSAAAVALMWLCPAVWSVYLGAGILGGACCFVKVFHYAFCPTLVPEKFSASAVAYIEATTMIAVLVTTYFVTYTMQFTGMLTFTQFLPVTLAIMLINTVLGAIAVGKVKKQNA